MPRLFGQLKYLFYIVFKSFQIQRCFFSFSNTKSALKICSAFLKYSSKVPLGHIYFCSSFIFYFSTTFSISLITCSPRVAAVENLSKGCHRYCCCRCCCCKSSLLKLNEGGVSKILPRFIGDGGGLKEILV